jgi:hypothetical protein
MYIYNSASSYFPTCVAGSYPIGEGAHSYFIVATGSVTSSAATMSMNNTTLWMATRG